MVHRVAAVFRGVVLEAAGENDDGLGLGQL